MAASGDAPPPIIAFLISPEIVTAIMACMIAALVWHRGLGGLNVDRWLGLEFADTEMEDAYRTQRQQDIVVEGRQPVEVLRNT